MTNYGQALGETVTIHRREATSVDGNGNDVYTETGTDEVAGCSIWPRFATELVQGQDTLITGLTVLLPDGWTASALDQVDARGDLYDIDGEPGGFYNPISGDGGGTQLALTRVTG